MSSDIARDLSAQTRELISRFEKRADSFARREDLARLAVGADRAAAEKAARDYIGQGEHLAAGIDGSMDYDERLQMMLFYSNATAYNCPFTVDDRVKFDLDSAFRDTKLSASAAVPLWAEDLGNVVSESPELDIELEHSMERIPNSFMALGELYLALQVAKRARVIFLDRPLSGTFSTLSRDARNLLKRGGSKLPKWGGGNVSQLDLRLAIQLGSPAMEVPVRRRHLPSAIVKRLVAGPMGQPELARALGVDEPSVERAMKSLRRLDERLGHNLLAEDGPGRVALAVGVAGYWERCYAMAADYARSVFEMRKHPLAVSDEEYLTILDVNTACLFLLDQLYEEARERAILLIGIAKDTTATDIARAVLPFAADKGFVKLDSPPPRLKSDRAFLAILSAENPSIATPWRTPGYDSAFSTIVKAGDEYVSARKVVSRERVFVRSFFQLRSLKTDPSIRSQVFLFDRPFDPERDRHSLRKFPVRERSGVATIEGYFEGDDGSELSNLALHILSLTDNPEVFEAFGHNQLLYLADKAVKAEVRLLRSSLRGVADLRVGGVSNRKKVFGLVTSYREQRAEAEHARMRSTGGQR